MNEFRAVAKTPAPVKVQQFLIEIRIRCPMCETKWMMQALLAKGERPRDAVGEAVLLEVSPGVERRAIRLETWRWGSHALCGNCFCRRAATVIEQGSPEARDGSTFSSRPWDSQDEAQMWGHLKHRQAQYEAMAILHGEWDGDAMELIDQQRERRREILGRGVVITRQRVKDLNLSWRGAI